MTEGKAGEFAHPYRLLVQNIGDDTITNQDGLFAKMIMATGFETAQSLFEIAKQQYYNKVDIYPDENQPPTISKQNENKKESTLP